MSKINKLLLAGLAVTLFLFVINAAKKPATKISEKSPEKAASENKTSPESQENEGGNVTVTVKPKTLEVGESPAFELEFETHSVDLSFDVTKQSYLRDDKGNRFDNGIWEGSPPGGHHRSGILTFDLTLADTKYIELILDNIAGVSKRKFRWSLYERR